MHWNMINDHVRNNAYEAAINEVVNSESVVIDLGKNLRTCNLCVYAAERISRVVFSILLKRF